MKKFLIDSIGKLDYIVWGIVLFFFSGSALLFGGNWLLAVIGAIGVIVELLFISIAIEIIIESLKNTKGIGTLTGFITNGPEAVCLIAGLAAGNIIFAASTPLGSNFMNPVLLFCAALICKQLHTVVSTKKLYTFTTLILSICLAGGFFLLSREQYFFWLPVAVTITGLLFWLRPEEYFGEEEEDYMFSPFKWLLPSILLLVTGGYYLDQVVSFAAEHSKAPKGVIGFIGLLVPHIGRLLVTSDHKYLIPYSILLGATMLLLSDTVGRVLAYPYEIQAAVIMSVIGGPFFIMLLKAGGKDYGN